MFPGNHVDARGDRPAIIMGGSEAVVTYAALDAGANRFSRVLRDLGVRPGDHVAFMIENHPRFYEVVWGAHYAGAIYTAISTRLVAEEVRYIIEDCGAQVVVTTKALADVVDQALDGVSAVDARLVIGGRVDGFDEYETLVESADPSPLPNRIAGVDMLYSSGTTGRPKGVLPEFEERPLDELATLGNATAGLFGVGADTVYLSPAPLYHAAPLRMNMSIHRAGGTSVIMERFDAEEFLRQVEAHQVTHTQVVPTMFIRMLKLPAEVRERYDVSSLRTAIHAAAPCPVEVKRQMIEWWGPIIHEYYAGTEGNGFVHCDSEQWLAHPGTVGRAILGEIHIVDEAGNDLPPGEIGTVYFAGGAPFEYHNDPDKTSASRNDRGWTTLGDVGRLDEDGYLYLSDRKSFMIITGGVNVYPQEVENLLVLHDEVVDAAVFGIPDPDFGEQVKAVVQPAPDGEDRDGLPARLLAYCREHLSSIKCPRSIDLMDELPRHPTGKLYKRLLRDPYWTEAS
ncbi:acyl-CoA synthetase [Acidimicrobiia bacterium EGI L10123]|uniref:acyl-CoA synthetase n=1 Tax=Salinilacustrithrix flava TaxID=2957203 RepID=UPI003D7C1656|nr:acyl-CoA synthetase [Acidimicrobiia bacterium EGI L10123]